jgi:hypothetical protein
MKSLSLFAQNEIRTFCTQSAYLFDKNVLCVCVCVSARARARVCVWSRKNNNEPNNQQITNTLKNKSINTRKNVRKMFPQRQIHKHFTFLHKNNKINHTTQEK